MWFFVSLLAYIHYAMEVLTSIQVDVPGQARRGRAFRLETSLGTLRKGVSERDMDLALRLLSVFIACSDALSCPE